MEKGEADRWRRVQGRLLHDENRVGMTWTVIGSDILHTLSYRCRDWMSAISKTVSISSEMMSHP